MAIAMHAIVRISGRDEDFEVVKLTDKHVGVRYVDRKGRPETETGIDFAVHTDFVTLKEGQ